MKFSFFLSRPAPVTRLASADRLDGHEFMPSHEVQQYTASWAVGELIGLGDMLTRLSAAVLNTGAPVELYFFLRTTLAYKSIRG
jgi:hypothetical protein